MKKTFFAAAVICSLAGMSAFAQTIEQPKLFDNINIGIDGGVTTPMNHGAFFGDMRGMVGIHIGKQLTPTFGAGIEASGAFNTSSWAGRIHSSTVFDQSYVGVYGTADLFNLFGGYHCAVRPFTIEALIGAGWGHDYFNESADEAAPYNYFVTKAGLNFNFNVSDRVTLSLKPSVAWNMIHEFDNGLVGYNINNATFNCVASVSYNFGPGFTCVRPYNSAQVNELNNEINDLRSQLATSEAKTQTAQQRADALAAQLAACQNKAPQVIKEVNNEYNSVRFVFFRIGSYAVTADQMPNVEMIADYMKSHPKSKVVIKGYASKDGNLDFNIKLAKNRAESVKNVLVKRFKINPDRITADGEGIGNMFEEESWNRVSICTLETE
ncbi:MAG: OmpA family protein [Muribaculaceae bacterium]|nr:OmpA family protein [Muribaculaceae bacterium]